MDINEIQKVLPHRYPFLLVDRVVELEEGKRLVARKNVTINEPFFNGHFPGMPVMPGVLILEALAQASALLAYKTLAAEGEDQNKVALLMAVDNAKFRKPVVPGDTLMLEVELVKHKGSIWKQRATASVDGNKVAEAEFLATVADGPEKKP